MPVLVQVVRAHGLPIDVANDVRVEYDFFIDEAPHQVPAVPGHNQEPVFDYKKNFVQDPVTSRFLNHCANKAIVFRIFGSSAEARKIQAEAEAAKMQPLTPVRPRADVAGGPKPDELPAACAATNVASPLEATATLETIVETPTSEAALPAPVEKMSPGRAHEPQAREDAPLPPAKPTLAQVRRDTEKAVAAIEAGKGSSVTENKSKTCSLL